MINLIVAVSKNRVIGNQGKMPWNYPEDLAYFKKITMGTPVLMGRKTFESIGFILPGRENIVLTRNKDFQFDGITIIHSYKEILDRKETIFIIGGSEIYKLYLPYADMIYLTEIDGKYKGDTFFPKLDLNWNLISTKKGKNRKLKFKIFKKKEVK